MTTHTNTFAIAFLGFILSTGQIPVLAADTTLMKTTDTSAYSPPSPDPSGIAYISSVDRLLITDGEVEEISSQYPGAYKGANLFETTRSGSLQFTSSTTGPDPNDSNDTSPPLDPPTNYSDEPVGAAFNPEDGHCFIADDDKNEVFEIDPGPDGDCFTVVDNTVTSFDTSTSPAFAAAPAHDPEGLGFDAGDPNDPTDNSLYIGDGSNREVYKLMPGSDGKFTGGGDDQMTHFDTQTLGLNVPDGLEFHPYFGHLFIIAVSGNKLGQVTPQGALVRMLDISAAGASSVAGVAVAPGSGTDPNPTVDNVYIVDRRVDNGTSASENDGRLYEFDVAPLPAMGNQPPSVFAGADRLINLPNSVMLDGTVSDDGQPNPLITDWRKVSGPGTATFGNASQVDTTASFSATGPYVLRLSADDGALSASDEVAITVNPPPSISTIYLSLAASSGTVGGISWHDHDILSFNGTSWSMYFDGEDVGVTGEIDALVVRPGGTILLSLGAAATLPGVGAVDDSDIVEFTPSSTGFNTAGTFTLFFRGASAGLGTDGEDIDAIGFTPDGALVVSTTSSPSVTCPACPSLQDEDLLMYTGPQLGAQTTNSWNIYFDGSDVALSDFSSEDVNGTELIIGDIYLTTTGTFSVPGVSGDGTDIFVCAPGSTGDATTCAYRPFFDGSANGLTGDVDAFDVQ